MSHPWFDMDRSPRYAERDDAGRALFRVRLLNCTDPLCDERGKHEHLYTISDLSAAQLLQMDERSFEEARLDLEAQYPGVYSTPAMAIWALEEERAEDEAKATDDMGRRVA